MKKKIIITLTFLSLILCLFFTYESYAKYISSTSEEANMQIARWRILVNNKDIRNESTTNAIITPIFEGNDNIASNIIAPTSTGYFDLIIDASQADVSFKYKIILSVNENSSVKDLIATSYQINTGEKISLTKDNQVIEGTIIHADNINTLTIRVYIVWDDSENATMDNTADTEVTKDSNNTAKFNVNLTFTQLA